MLFRFGIQHQGCHQKNWNSNSFTHGAQRVRAFQIELEFGLVKFQGEGKTGVPGEKPLGASERTNNKVNPHMASTPRWGPGISDPSY